jgi:hypothetical protein
MRCACDVLVVAVAIAFVDFALSVLGASAG